jgi:NAD(P)-dependent dehydrogenase (short-subunit alcohol dehydrogenase family)
MSDRFSGQVVLIAGGTGGLGRSVTLAFLDEGATVVATYQNPAEFDVVSRAAGANAARLEGQALDVLNETAVRGLVDSIVAKHGRLDALTNAVGGYAAGKSLWEAEAKTLDLMLGLNLRSGYFLARAVAPVMLKQARGAIVNVSSTAALNHSAASAEYSASKAAAVAMIDCLAADLKGTGVRANSILPSIIDTEANRKAIPGADYSKWPKPQDLARVILFLCSEESKAINGAAIVL